MIFVKDCQEPVDTFILSNYTALVVLQSIIRIYIDMF